MGSPAYWKYAAKEKVSLYKCLTCSYKAAFPIPAAGHSSAWPHNSWLESATSSLLLPTVALQNKNTVKQQHGFQVYYPEMFLTAHISCKAFTPPHTFLCPDCQTEFSPSHASFHYLCANCVDQTGSVKPASSDLFKIWWSLARSTNYADDGCLANTRKKLVHVLTGK